MGDDTDGDLIFLDGDLRNISGFRVSSILKPNLSDPESEKPGSSMSLRLDSYARLVGDDGLVNQEGGYQRLGNLYMPLFTRHAKPLTKPPSN